MDKARLIIFEGADGAGKSSLINKISSVEPNNYIVSHNGVYKDREEAFMVYNAQLSIPPDSQLILDRSYISELIYGNLIRGEDNSLCIDKVNKLEEKIKIYFRPLVILCNPPINTILSNWEGRIDDEYVKYKDKIELIYNEYQLIEQYTSLPIVRFDYTKQEQSYIALIKELIK